jgi:hypothetical protein
MKTSSNSQPPREKAQGIVEFALVLPFLLLLMFGIIEAGRLLFIYSVVTTSSREAARYGSAAGDVGGYVAHYQDCAGIRAAAKRVGVFAGIADGDITIRYDHGPNTPLLSSSCPPPSGQDVKLGDRIEIRIIAYYKPLLPLVKFAPFPITSTTRRTILKDVSIEGTPPAPYPTNTSTPTSTATATDTPTNTPTSTATPTPTETPTPTQGPSPTPTQTYTPTPTETLTPTPTFTATFTPTPTYTATPQCNINGGSLSLGPQTISWTLTNLGPHTVILTTLAIDWPDDRPPTRLNQVTFGATVWSGNVDNSLTICEACWNQGLTSDRLFSSLASKSLGMSYSRSLYTGEYAITASFRDTVTDGICSISIRSNYTAPPD